jgi:hypothetical protein
VNTEDVIVPKLIHDFAGHYNRFDLFSVSISAGDRGGWRTLSPSGSGEPGRGWLEQKQQVALDDRSTVFYLEGPAKSGDEGI